MTPDEIKKRVAEQRAKREAEEALLPRLPTHDERTGKKLLDKAELKDGAYYVGRCRNATVARWNAKKQCFTHWRVKFNSVFLEDIKHPVDDDTFDVFRVIRELPGGPKFVIPIDPQIGFDGGEMPEQFRYKFEGDIKDLDEYNPEVWCTCTPEKQCLHCKYRERT